MKLLLTSLLLTKTCIVTAGSLGKAFRQLILTLSLFLIAAANHKGKLQRSSLIGTVLGDFAVSDQVLCIRHLQQHALTLAHACVLLWSCDSLCCICMDVCS